jgi:hypothetical protein
MGKWLGRLFDSSVFNMLAVVLLGFVYYGWIFHPALGTAGAVIMGIFVPSFVLAALVARWFNRQGRN